MAPNVDLESVVSEPPTDVQHPKLYENNVLVLGVIAALCVLAIGVLTGLGFTVDAVVTGLVAIAGQAVGGLVRLMEPRK